jgi:hypothetical protein
MFSYFYQMLSWRTEEGRSSDDQYGFTPIPQWELFVPQGTLRASSPHERSDMRVHPAINPGYRFAHPGYAC